MKMGATLSTCGRFRWTLTRQWDDRPTLLAAMFNPSTADDQANDPTISLLSHIASWNGFGGLVVVNAIPLRSSKTAPAIAWVRERTNPEELQHNFLLLRAEASKASAVLLAWGALGEKVPQHMREVQGWIRAGTQDCVPVLCIRETAGGWPLHPLARGKHKVRKDARFEPWRWQVVEPAAAMA